MLGSCSKLVSLDIFKIICTLEHNKFDHGFSTNLKWDTRLRYFTPVLASKQTFLGNLA